jgi:hypothetical protein
MVTEGIEPSTVALLAQRSNQLSYATYLSVTPVSQSYQVASDPLTYFYPFILFSFFLHLLFTLNLHK